MKKLLFTLIVLKLTFFANSILAEETNYQIELIVFAQKHPNTEVFEQTASRIEWPSGLTEISSYKIPGQFFLNGSEQALANNTAYQMLLKSAWIQTLPENVKANPVRIESSDGKINGFLQIDRTRTLQVLLDLEYQPDSIDTGESFTYRLNEKRQVLLNDINYFDHPKFGAIAKVFALTSP